jgi:hypothetical protein
VTDFVCGIDDCDFEVPTEKRSHAAQSLAMHRARTHNVYPAKSDVVKVRKPYRRKQLDAFIQEQNIDTATAYVIAAKWPAGIPVEDIPRVIKLVKAVNDA